MIRRRGVADICSEALSRERTFFFRTQEKMDRYLKRKREEGSKEIDLSNITLTRDLDLSKFVDISKIKSLNLHLCRLFILPDISNLSSLKKLIISGNKIASLPNWIGCLSTLKKLNLSWNWLGSLPDSIGELSHLKVLDLNGNRLGSLPDSIGNLSSLKSLYLCANRLSSLPDSLGKLSSVRYIFLEGNAEIPLDDRHSLEDALTRVRCRTCRRLRWKVPFRRELCFDCLWIEKKLTILGSREESSKLSWLPREIVRYLLEFL